MVVEEVLGVLYRDVAEGVEVASSNLLHLRAEVVTLAQYLEALRLRGALRLVPVGSLRPGRRTLSPLLRAKFFLSS
jgi:hypothetical protein